MDIISHNDKFVFRLEPGRGIIILLDLEALVPSMRTTAQWVLKLWTVDYQNTLPRVLLQFPQKSGANWSDRRVWLSEREWMLPGLIPPFPSWNKEFVNSTPSGSDSNSTHFTIWIPRPTQSGLIWFTNRQNGSFSQKKSTALRKRCSCLPLFRYINVNFIQNGQRKVREFLVCRSSGTYKCKFYWRRSEKSEWILEKICKSQRISIREFRSF